MHDLGDWLAGLDTPKYDFLLRSGELEKKSNDYRDYQYIQN